MARDSAHSISPEELLKAYALGYFPMAQHRHDPHAMWVLPDERGVLILAEARAPRRLRRTIAKAPFDVRIDTAFSDVIAACAAESPGRHETWINDQIIEAYTELHALGAAHSVECYEGGALIGGLYGVAIGGIFCGESMFSRRTDASKIAMAHLIARLKIGGFSVLDTQFFTEHLAQFGVIEIPDTRYQDLLREHLGEKGDFSAAPAQLAATTVLQSITQTS